MKPSLAFELGCALNVKGEKRSKSTRPNWMSAFINCKLDIYKTYQGC